MDAIARNTALDQIHRANPGSLQDFILAMQALVEPLSGVVGAVNEAFSVMKPWTQKGYPGVDSKFRRRGRN